MAAMFQFVGGGIGVMPDPADNPGGHTVPHHDSGTRISFEVMSVGDVDGNAAVDVELDDAFMASWTSSTLSPGQRQVGFASIGRLGEGSHSVQTILNPGAGTADHETNAFDVE